MKRPLFLVGAPRSGTTLLRLMLDRNPALAIPPESHFIPKLWRGRRRYGRGDVVEDRRAFLDDLVADKRFGDWGLPREEVERAVANASIPFAGAIDAVYQAYARREGKARWGDKTPEYVDHAALLATLFPEARFLHLVRDGRDVALSVLDVGRRHTHAATVAMSWRRTMQTADRARRRVGADRWMDVRYEDLVEAPDVVLKAVCWFAGIAYSPVMLDTQAASAKVPATRRSWHGNLERPVTPGLRDWRTQMLDGEVAEFEVVAGGELVRAGYELSEQPRGPIVAASAWRRVALFPVTRRRRVRSHALVREAASP